MKIFIVIILFVLLFLVGCVEINVESPPVVENEKKTNLLDEENSEMLDDSADINEKPPVAVPSEDAFKRKFCEIMGFSCEAHSITKDAAYISFQNQFGKTLYDITLLISECGDEIFIGDLENMEWSNILMVCEGSIPKDFMRIDVRIEYSDGFIEHTTVGKIGADQDVTLI